jgi:hypothetical protein
MYGKKSKHSIGKENPNFTSQIYLQHTEELKYEIHKQNFPKNTKIMRKKYDQKEL